MSKFECYLLSKQISINMLRSVTRLTSFCTAKTKKGNVFVGYLSKDGLGVDTGPRAKVAEAMRVLKEHKMRSEEFK